MRQLRSEQFQVEVNFLRWFIIELPLKRRKMLEYSMLFPLQVLYPNVQLSVKASNLEMKSVIGMLAHFHKQVHIIKNFKIHIY